MGTVQSASAALEEVGIAFSYPKPSKLLEYLVEIGSAPGDLILDSLPVPELRRKRFSTSTPAKTARDGSS